MKASPAPLSEVRAGWRAAELESVRARVSAYPGLARAFDVLLPRLAEWPEVVRITAEGSLGGSTPFDGLSDFDLAIHVNSQRESLAEVETWLISAVSSMGRLLAYFPASHLGLAHIHIFFVEVPGEIVKVDVKLLHVGEGIAAGAGPVLFGAERQPVSTPAGSAVDAAEVRLAEERFAGWTWYTYTKLARGEMLEAVSSVAIMRERALVLCWQIAEGLPHEGYRRLEQRLSAPALALLRRTYPQGHERGEVLRALAATISAFRLVHPRAAQRTGATPKGAGLEAIVSRVCRDEPGFAQLIAQLSAQLIE